MEKYKCARIDFKLVAVTSNNEWVWFIIYSLQLGIPIIRENKNKNPTTTSWNKRNVSSTQYWKRNVSLDIYGEVRVEPFWSEMSVYKWKMVQGRIETKRGKVLFVQIKKKKNKIWTKARFTKNKGVFGCKLGSIRHILQKIPEKRTDTRLSRQTPIHYMNPSIDPLSVAYAKSVCGNVIVVYRTINLQKKIFIQGKNYSLWNFHPTEDVRTPPAIVI